MEKTLDEALKEFEPPYRLEDDGNQFVKVMIPYALYWRPSRLYQGNRHNWVQSLTAIPLIGHNGTPMGIRHYSRKQGWKLVNYWTPNEGKFFAAREELDLILNRGEERVRELEAEKTVLQRRVEELEAKESEKRSKEPKSKNE